MIEVLRVQRHVYASASRAEIPWTSTKRVDRSRRSATSTAACALRGLCYATFGGLLRAWYARSEHDESGQPDGPCGKT